MTKAVFQIGSRIFRSEFMTMRSTVSAWAAMGHPTSIARAASHRTKSPKMSRRSMAFLPSLRDNATQLQRRECGRRAGRGQQPDPVERYADLMLAAFLPGAAPVWPAGPSREQPPLSGDQL